MHYARPLGVDRVLALAPITGGAEYARKVAKHLPAGAVNPWQDLVPIFRRGPRVRIRVMYGEQNAGDQKQSMRLAGLPGITVEALPEWDSHHLISGLIRAGRLEEMLSWLVSPDTAL
jgi:hypothetical protein